MLKKKVQSWALFLCALLTSTSAFPETCRLAVASNFSSTIKILASQFEQNSHHKITISTGSTGQLFAQIQNGAPFDIFMAADTKRPQILVESRDAVAGSVISYAQGTLALWSPKTDVIINQQALLSNQLKKIAIANPKTAPYGKAALEVLSNINDSTFKTPKLVYGENISQVMLFTASENVNAGFIALSQIKSLPKKQRGSWWLIPQDFYQPINQQAALLQHGKGNIAALAFMIYLKSPQAKDIILRMGYSLPNPENPTQ